MKKKKMATAALAAMMALTAVGGMTVYGASDTKTATLNNAQVRFNNGKVQTIQCYNIEGFNFVRARDITNNLDMAVYAIQNGNKGVMVDPLNKPTSKDALEKLTQASAKVKVEKGQMIYDGMVSEAECFLLNGRYYFKLADFQKASDYSLETSLELTEIQAKGDIATAAYAEFFPGITVTWNNDTKVIEVDRVETDLQQIFDDIRAGKVETAKPDKEEVVEKDEEKESVAEKEDKFEATGVLTSAPKEGKILANILKDKDEGAYLADGSVNWDNVTVPYSEKYTTEANFGQCSWYAEARLIETTGVNVHALWGDGVAKWVEKAQNGKSPDLDGVTNPNKIVPGCIAVWKNHVAFVEWVEYDNNGNPEKVYFTEANAYHKGNMKNGVYYPDFDGKVQVMSIDKFVNGRASDFVGYVVVK